VRRVGTAVIGVIGVVVGALVAGLLSARAEREKARGRSRVAGSLIASELETSRVRLKGAHEDGRWWSAELSTRSWQEQGGALAEEAGGDLIDALVAAYDVLESWDDDRRRCADITPLLDDLKTQVDGLPNLIRRTKEVGRPPIGARLKPPLRLLGFVALAVSLVALAIAAFAPRPELTDASIAGALQDQLVRGALVDCSKAEDRWHCDVSYPRAVGRCNRQAMYRSPTAAELVALESTHECPVGRAGKELSYDVGTGADGPVATASQGQRERQRQAARYLSLSPPETNLFTRFIKRISGDE
jgi:hypothetical protein